MARTFAKYLVDHGVVSAAQALDALEICAGRRTPIGRMAVAAGYLTMRDVFKVLQKQAGTHWRFGEVAMEMGLLSMGQVADLLRKQEMTGPTFADVLVACGAIAREAVDAAWIDFESARRDELHEPA